MRALLLALLLAPPALAAPAPAPACNKFELCVGDKTWAYYSGDLHLGTVKAVKADGSVNFNTDGEKTPSWIAIDRIVITKGCSPKNPLLCAGNQSWRSGDSGEIDGKVVGYFTTGYVAVTEGKGVHSYKADDFTEFRAKPCSKGKLVCVGDEAFLDDGKGLHLTKIDAIDTATGTISGGGAQAALAGVAAIGRHACGLDAKGVELCPGEPVLHDGKIGTLLGAFPDGTLVLGSRDGVTRVKGSDLAIHQPNDAELHDIALGLSAIGHIDDLLTATKWADCSGTVAQPGAHAIAPGVALNCDEPNVASKGEDSPNLQKFRKLLADGTKAPLASFLILWYPDNGDGLNLGSPFFKCETDEQGSFSKTIVGCHPDLLYSWGPVAKENDVMRHLADDGKWTGGVTTFQGGVTPGTVFTSISPASTYGYGNVLLRFKIKREAKYANIDFGAQDHTIGVREDQYHDFAISDPRVIESVSAGTPEMYDEVVRDVLHFKANKRVSTYQTVDGTGIDRLYAQAADENTMDEDGLKARLLALIRTILAGEGKITFAAGACRNRALNFATDSPSFVDPLGAPNAPPAPQLPVPKKKP